MRFRLTRLSSTTTPTCSGSPSTIRGRCSARRKAGRTSRRGGWASPTSGATPRLPPSPDCAGPTGGATVELDAPARHGSRSPRCRLQPDPPGHRRAVRRGADFTVNGFRNRDLQGKLYPAAATDVADAKRRTHRTSRLIAQLRGLITRDKNSRLYRLTAKGFKAMWPAVRFRRIDFPTAFRAAQAA